MKYEMNLYHNAFELLKNGKKRVEMRLYDEKRRKLKKYDQIEFTDTDTKEKLILVIEDIYIFPDFKELYQHFSKVELGYLPEEEASYEDMYKYYSSEDILKYGVVGIKLFSRYESGRQIRIANTISLLKDFCDENLDEETAKEVKAILE